MKIRYLLADPRFIARDNEGGDAGGDSTPDDSQGGDAGQSAVDRSFTQTDVDQIVVKRVKKLKDQLETTERRYESMISDTKRSQQERDELAQELEALQSQFRTREEQARYEAKKREAEFNKNLESATSEAKQYRSLFETQTRNNEILSAASQHDAFNPELFIDVLAPRTEVVAEELDNGEKTGRYVTRVRVQKADEDGNVSEVLVTPSEAIEDMKNNPEKFGGLFRGNVAKGIGEGSNASFAGSGRVDVTKMSMDEYVKNRAAIQGQYGIKDPRSRSGF